ncbi:MAG: homoserine kinase [Acidimicrobiia bacterium]|nr:homoserine kinase [Acidimicrobiia bacterium]
MRAPASSANLGPGFDVLGLALRLHTEVAADGAGEATEVGHPAHVAFSAAGGHGEIWVRTEIPQARGLGFSGSARVAGAMLAFVQQGLSDEDARDEAFAIAAQLEGHADNAAAAALGGAVVVAGDTIAQLPVALDASVVVWVPQTTSRTEDSRRALPETVSYDDAVFNLGSIALLVTAITTGDHRLLERATADRLHQPARLAGLPGSAAAIDAMYEAGAWGAWLSGSGPTVAGFVDPEAADDIAALLPDDGHAQVVSIDVAGATVVDRN